MKNKKIYFWPRWFIEAWPADQKPKINKRLLGKLQSANIYLWEALNIYDDIIDQEGKNIKLPLANNNYRKFLEIYYRLNLPASFYQTFNQIMTDLDRANHEEALFNHFRTNNGQIIYPKKFPIFTELSDLSRKSLALGLGPVALLYYQNQTKIITKTKLTLELFRYTLAAKQLADDARDWFTDLTSGIITAANLPILKAAQKRCLVLNLKQQPEIIHLLFVTEAATKISGDLKKLCHQARKSAATLGLKSDCRLLTEILGPIENGLRESALFRAQWLKNVEIML